MARRRVTRPKAKEPVFEMEPVQEGASIFDYLSIWYGPPKIGKSKMVSCLGNPGDVYFLCTEPGYRWLKIRKDRIDCWEDFVLFVRKASKKKKFVASVRMWCIDPVDKLAKYCMSYVCDKRKIDHPSDQEWGKGWEAFGDEFTEWMLKLCAIGPGVAAISHVKERKVIIDGVESDKETPAMAKKCYTILNDLADITIKFEFEPKKRGKRYRNKERRRCLRLRGTDSKEAGDRTGMLPPLIPYNTEQEAINKIMSCFEGRKEEPKKKKKKTKKRK